jgi:alpha-beta hydrolase superfamily lysophospholipase/SAM-dependent methyltransferase
MFHRGHEHSGRLQELAEALVSERAVFAWDARGHGRSAGERGYADHFMDFVKDADAFGRHVAQEYGIALENTVAVGHSVGAVIAATWIHDFAPPLRGLILATPAFRVRLYIPLAISGLRLLHWLRGKCFIKSYVKANMLTHDSAQATAYQNDSLIERTIAVNILLDLHDASTRIVSDAGAVNIPTLMFSSESDWVVKFAPQVKFIKDVSSSRKEHHYLPGFYHAIYHETQRELPIGATRRFIADLFSAPPTQFSLLQADRAGYTCAEHKQLSQPLPIYSPKRWWFALQRLSLKTVGKLSNGVRRGLETGFDSGQTLDYVYENQPRGKYWLGRIVDRRYLNAIGWRGIRVRKENLGKLLRYAIEQIYAAGKPVHVVDIATGCGRYVLETLQTVANIPVTAHLRDFIPENLEEARRVASGLGLSNVAFAQGDAFDEASLSSLLPRPTVAVVSGLYELFPDNEMVIRSLRGLSEAVEDGGYLVYTNQPWHPQLEMIARVLTSHRHGKPWIMRRRTQAEMDEIVRSVGFKKERMEIDPWGIFTVSLARKAIIER